MTRIHPDQFKTLLVDETREDKRVFIFRWEEDEIDRLTEEEFRTSHHQEYRKACEQAEEKWYPYHAAEVFDEIQLYQYKSYDVDDFLRKRWRVLKEQARQRYIDEIKREISRAVKRREELRPKYPTTSGFLVKSQGEQVVANALFEFKQAVKQEGGKKITFLYEPLLRIPEEHQIIVPDFVFLEICLVVEYAGLSERNYKVGLMLKIDALRKLGVPVIVVRPEDLNDVKKALSQKLRFYFGLGK